MQYTYIKQLNINAMDLWPSSYADTLSCGAHIDYVGSNPACNIPISFFHTKISNLPNTHYYNKSMKWM